MKKILTLAFLIMMFVIGYGQKKAAKNIDQYLDLTGTIGSSEGSIAGAYVHNWQLGKKKKLELGWGARVTGYFGTKKDFITAPAKLARSTTFPFIIIFAGQLEKNFDTLTVQRPFTTSVNLSFNAAYNFNSRFSGGLNIDVIGVTFGRNSSAIFKSNGITTTEPVAKPAVFNLLLTGDNDLGNLNSEFFLKYKLNKKWGIRAVYQFLFSEYKTSTIKQIAPGGTVNDRFRNKVNALGIGISYHL